jgi:hypothetical protein
VTLNGRQVRGRKQNNAPTPIAGHVVAERKVKEPIPLGQVSQKLAEGSGTLASLPGSSGLPFDHGLMVSEHFG